MNPGAVDWEEMWARYDPATYRWVLDQIGPQDIVVDIGAGDLRLARRMAAIARKVIAIEKNPEILAPAVLSSHPLPENMTVICADALEAPLPERVTAAVLLMRHCTYYRQYAQRLRRAGCRRMITNARWRMGVEVVDLLARRQAYQAAPMGWYACECGAVGFKPGPAEDWDSAQDELTHELMACPQCENGNQ